MTNIAKKDADGLICVTLDVHIWSGRRLLDKTDLIHANPEFRKLPEKDLANLGSVKICDPEDIKKFQKVKGKAERALARAGLPFLGSIGIPDAKFEELHLELVGFQNEFKKLEEAFLLTYDKRLVDWKLKHTLQNPTWTSLFNDLPSVKKVAGRLGFDFHCCRISAPADESRPDLNRRFNDQVGGLKGSLLKEVAAEANMLIQDYLMGQDGAGVTKRREHITPKTLGPLKRAADKLTSFGFLDPTIGPLADVIAETLKTLPNVGRIEGQSLVKVWTLARLLADSDQAVQIARMAAEGKSADDLLAGTVDAMVLQAQDSQRGVGAQVGNELGLDLTEFIKAPTVARAAEAMYRPEADNLSAMF